MAYSHAQAIITGRVGKAPEKRSDKAPAEFSVAVDQGTREERTSAWYTVKAFGKLGDVVMQAVGKGDLVTVHGRMEQRKWTSAAGKEGLAIEVSATDIVFASKPKAEQQGEPADRGFWE